jgi:hypothetical protein
MRPGSVPAPLFQSDEHQLKVMEDMRRNRKLKGRWKHDSKSLMAVCLL